LPSAAHRPRPPRLHRHQAKLGQSPNTTSTRSTIYSPASSLTPPPAGEAAGEEGGRSRDLRRASQGDGRRERGEKGGNG
jgi:hypothetical protein